MASRSTNRRASKLVDAKEALDEIAKNPALAEALGELRSLIANDGFDGMYAVATEALRIRSEHGRAFLRAHARSLHLPMARLFTWAKVAEVFRDEAVKEIRARKNPFGFPLRFEHFVQLVRVGSATERDRLIDQAIADGLDEDELREEVNEVVDTLWWAKAKPDRVFARMRRLGRVLERAVPVLIERSKKGGKKGERARAELEALTNSLIQLKAAFVRALERANKLPN